MPRGTGHLDDPRLDVYRVCDRQIAREAILDLSTATQEQGTYTLRGLSDANYTIDVVSDCAWTFRVTR